MKQVFFFSSFYRVLTPQKEGLCLGEDLREYVGFLRLNIQNYLKSLTGIIKVQTILVISMIQFSLKNTLV